MYFIIKPKKQSIVTRNLKEQISPYTKNITIRERSQIQLKQGISVQNTLPGYLITFYNKNSHEYFTLCDIESFYKFSDGNTYIDSLHIKFLDIPAYTNRSEHLLELINALYTIYGDYSIYDYYTDSTYEISPNSPASEIVTEINDSISKSVQDAIEYSNSFNGERDFKKVQQIIKNAKPGYRAVEYSHYLYLLSQSSLLNQQIVERCYKAVLTDIMKIDKEYRNTVLYIFVLYYKKSTSSVTEYLGREFFINEYWEYIKTLDPELESAQFLFAELFYTLLGKYFNVCQEVFKDIITMQEKVQGLFLPEFSSRFIEYSSGDYNQAYKEYLRLAKSNPYRKSYLKIVNTQNEIAMYYRYVFAKYYHTRINIINAVSISFHRFSSLTQEETKWYKITAISVISVLIPVLFTQVYSRVFSADNSFIYSYNDLVSSEKSVITSIYMLNIIFVGGCNWLANTLIATIKKKALRIIITTGSYLTILFFGLIINLVLIDDVFYGFKSDSLQKGYLSYDYSEYKDVVFFKYTPIHDDNNTDASSTYFYVYLTENNDQVDKIKLIEKNGKTISTEKLCKVYKVLTEKIPQSSESEKLNVSISDTCSSDVPTD